MDLPGLASLLAIGLGLGWVLLTAHTYRTLTRPGRRTYGWAVARGLPGDPSELRIPGQAPGFSPPWDRWEFQASGLSLPVWDITGLDASGPCVILTHGWGDSRVSMLGSGRVAAALPLVSRLILWDMPGHGEAPGRCTLGLHEPAALAALVRKCADPQRPVILWGYSLGARVSILAAPLCPEAGAVIAEAPYIHAGTPARNVMRTKGMPYRSNLPPSLALIRLLHRAPSTASLARPLSASEVRLPLLVLHGSDDHVSPVEDGRAIATSAPHGRIAEIPNGRHQTLFLDALTAPEATRAIAGFLTRAAQEPRPGPA